MKVVAFSNIIYIIYSLLVEYFRGTLLKNITFENALQMLAVQIRKLFLNTVCNTDDNYKAVYVFLV